MPKRADKTVQDTAATIAAEPVVQPSPSDIAEPEGLPVDEAIAPAADAGSDAAAKAGGEGQDQVDADLAARAMALGLGETEIKSFSSNPQSLAKVLDAYDKAVAVSVPPAPKAEKSDEQGDFQITLDPEIYDKDVVSQFQKLNEHWSRKFAALSQDVSQTKAQARSERISGHFSGLDDEWRELFDDSSRGSANRRKVERHMEVLAAGHKAVEGTVPAEGDLFQRAVRAVFPDHVAAVTRRTVADKLRNQAGQFIAQPTQRGNGATLTPRQRALAAIRQYKTENRLEETGGELGLLGERS